jgi:hypothetical protein
MFVDGGDQSCYYEKAPSSLKMIRQILGKVLKRNRMKTESDREVDYRGRYHERSFPKPATDL